MSPSTESKAWILIAASSAACLLGSFVVFFDLLWSKVFPSSKFQFQNNKQVMVASLSLSSGVLLFTSMYRLLPEALEYFQSSPELKGNNQLANMVLIGSYIIGISICAGFNGIIHALTSQSVVHCVHDEDGDDFGDEYGDFEGDGINHHSHSHGNNNLISDIEANPGNNHHHDFHNHDGDHHHHHHPHHHHDHPHPSPHPPQSPLDTEDPLFKSKNNSYGTLVESSNSGSAHDDSDDIDETSPLIDEQITTLITANIVATPNSRPKLPSRKISILDITQNTFQGKKPLGVCMGYTTIEQCTFSKCCNTNNIETEQLQHSQTIIIPTIEEVNNDVYPSHPTSYQTRNQSSSHLSLHSTHTEHPHFHHHHVISQYSQLFSIGIQTALAITVHKIPEGILTFATYHADQSLGFSVFLALAIHNFSEGFAIVFPLFLATQNRLIAFSIAALLGGISQPVGALIAWLFFRNKFTNESTSLTFGLIVSLTAGFMSIIGLQMYGTSIAFGGQQSVTLTWAFTGVAIVGISACLV